MLRFIYIIISIALSYSVYSQTLQSFSIGANKGYTSIGAALSSINSIGVSSTIVLEIDSGIYYEQLIINNITGLSANNKIIIESATGNAEDVIIVGNYNNIYQNYLIRFNSSQDIILRNITLKNLNQSSTGRIIEFLNNATNISFENVYFETNISSASTTANEIIYKGDNSGSVKNINFIDCKFKGGNNQISINNTLNAQNSSASIRISNCEFLNTKGENIKLSNFKKVIIENNEFKGGPTNLINYAINCINTDDTLRIEKNKILAEMQNTGIKVSGANFSSQNPGIIANNFVHRNNNMAAVIIAGSNISIIHNTIHVSGSTSLAYNIYINNSSSGIILKNNILSNYAQGFALNSQIPTNQLISDYNDFSSNGTYLINTLNFGSFANINSWTNSTGNDQHSVNIDPEYYFPFDMHMRKPQLNNLGTPIAGFNTDIDNETRSLTNPDIGADEFNSIGYDLSLIKIFREDESNCMGQSEKIMIEVQNRGTMPINFSQNPCILNISSIGLNPIIFSQKLINSGIISIDSFMEIELSNSFDMSQPGEYKFICTANITNDDIPLNNINVNLKLNNESEYIFPIHIDFEMIDQIMDTHWKLYGTTNYQWQIGNGLINNSTGPAVDHTKETSFGKYLYIENNNTSINNWTSFESPCLFLNSLSNPQLLFWYHMFGSGIGSLRVDIKVQGQWINGIYNIQGQQQNSNTSSWQKVQINLSNFSDVEKVRFYGSGGSNGAIALDDILISEAPRLNKNGNIELCSGDTIIIKAPSGSNCIWKSYPQNQQIAITTDMIFSAAGKYTAEITTDAGLTYTDTINIEIVQPPQIIISGIENICAQSPKIITNASASDFETIHWQTTGDGALKFANSNFPFYTPGANDETKGEVYLVINAYGKGSCNDIKDSVKLIILPLPQVNAGEDTSVDCHSTLGVNIGNQPISGFSYQWIPSIGLSNPQSSSTSALPIFPTDYMLITTNQTTGCSNRDTVHIGITNGPQAQITPNNSICKNESKTLSATGGNIYLWSNGATTSSINISPQHTTTYSVSVSNGSCGDIATTIITVNPLPKVDLGSDTIICFNKTIPFNISNEFQAIWNGNFSGNNYTYLSGNNRKTESIWVEIIDSNNCKNVDSLLIITENCNLSSETDLDEISLYPNPAESEINIRTKEGDLYIEIHNITGQLVFSKNVITQTNSVINLSLLDLTDGVYFLRIRNLDNNSIQIKKFIKNSIK